MIDIATARKRAKDYLGIMETATNSDGSASFDCKNRPKVELLITREDEYEFGWMFFYNSKEFVETGDHKHALAGNAPLIIDRNEGRIYTAGGTAHSLDHYIDEFRRGVRHPVKVQH